MNLKEIFEAVSSPMTGYLNVQGLANLLPDITNINNFTSAMNKLRLGQGDILTIPEKMELAMAFISFVGLDAPGKTLVSRQVSAIQDVKNN